MNEEKPVITQDMIEEVRFYVNMGGRITPERIIRATGYSHYEVYFIFNELGIPFELDESSRLVNIKIKERTDKLLQQYIINKLSLGVTSKERGRKDKPLSRDEAVMSLFRESCLVSSHCTNKKELLQKLLESGGEKE